MKLKLDNKGISLAMTIGLLLLLVLITTTINELVIRALRSAHLIEASDKAYFAAEAGIEDALYELSAHTAGYETPELGDAGNVRTDDFTENITWNNEWQIANHDLNSCGEMSNWISGYNPTFCGRLYEGDKLVINFFNDEAINTGPTANQINVVSADIIRMTLSTFNIKFRIPGSVISAHPQAFNAVPALNIDNDLDYDGGNGLVNEDGPNDAPNPCPYSAGVVVNDNDCDGKEDEDGSENIVLLWKVTDDKGNSFQPTRGCKSGSVNYPTYPGNPGGSLNSLVCEGSFRFYSGPEISTSIRLADTRTISGTSYESLEDFLNGLDPDSNVQMEILAVPPFNAVDQTNFERIPIPYLEYGIEYTGDAALPATYFSIRSDGYYKDYKQSITTNVVPRATTKLLDLTIIQQ